MSPVRVAAGIVLNKSDTGTKVLLAKRSVDQHQGGLWEFPGGKLELEESAEQALVRELNEELGISVEQCQFFEEVNFDYGDKSVCLLFYIVDQFSGKEQGLEGQQVRWVDLKNILQFEFPKANQVVVNKLLTFVQ